MAGPSQSEPRPNAQLIEIKANGAVTDSIPGPLRVEVIVTFPLHIAFRNMDASESAEALVRQRALDLEHFSGRISSCRVVLDCVHRQNSTGRLYMVHVDLSLPGGSIMVSRDHGSDHSHDDLPMAIRDAFETARRKLQAAKNATMRRPRAANGADFGLHQEEDGAPG